MKMLTVFIYLSVFCACEKSISNEDIQRPKSVNEHTVPRFPYPQRVDFDGCIKPDHVSQEQLDRDIVNYYKYWKNKYVKKSNGNTPGGGYYVEMKGTGGDGSEITTSEAHGYGMLIFALMAGADEKAKTYFDGMFNMFDKHRSTINAHCMSWVIHHTENTRFDKGSAADGDLDIAYSLVLAHRQWGSEGKINYLKQVTNMIEKGLKTSIVNPVSKRIMLGDWDTDPLTTRSSDWMTGHFHTFAKIRKDPLWNTVADTIYSMVSQLNTNFSKETGLIPDFVEGSPPVPASEYFLDEFKETDEYNWNACRYPWRITIDFAHFGSEAAYLEMKQLNKFIRQKTNQTPANIKAGYYLHGEPITDYSSMAFTAPLVATSIVSPSSQAYLNKGWELLKSSRESYFADTICLLNMLLIAGNWWNPA